MISQELARVRSQIIALLRSFFVSHNFLEVETPLLVPRPSQEPNLEPFETTLQDPRGSRQKAYLIASPEYAMKRLLAAGYERIFQISKCFRNREGFGGIHNPEFTMLEWYAAGQSYEECMQQVEDLVKYVAAGMGRADLLGSWTKKSVEEIWREAGREIPQERYFEIFLNEIEQTLGVGSPLILYDYPKGMASLARLNSDGKTARRFELYIVGLELANAFDELTDAGEQRARFLKEQEQRRAQGLAVHPLDEEFLKAIDAMPQATGVALGVDRLVLLLTNTSNINEVIYFPAKELFERYGNDK